MEHDVKGHVGHSIPRVEGKAKVAGTVPYVMNMKVPGMLFAKLLRSTVPHGRIVRIDTSEAAAMPNVFRVVTAEDLRAMGIDLDYGPAFRDQPLLAYDKVRFVGDPIAAVLSEDPYAAEFALQKIRVEIEELEPVLDVRDAVKEGAPLVHENLRPSGNFGDLKSLLPPEGTNICLHYKLRRGDVEKAFAQADYVFEDEFTTPQTFHLPMESHSVLAQVEKDGRVEIWSSTQSPSPVRAEVARILGVPQSRVRIRVPFLGAGYGNKLYLKAEGLVAALAKLSGRPVKLNNNASQSFFMLTKHGTASRFKTGVTRDGKIVARKCEILWDTGAYADIGPRVAQKSGFIAAGPYDIPNVHIDSYCVYTNHIPSGAFRGFGVPEVVWASDAQIDMIARRLGWDPVAFRRRNLIREGQEYCSGQKLRAVSFPETVDALDKALELSKPVADDGLTLREPHPKQPQGRFARGKGMAIGLKATTTPTVSGAIVNLSADGSATVYVSTVDMGQGSATILGQMVADGLQIPREAVHVVHPDTDVTPFDTITASSRSTFHMGNAIRGAVQEVKDQIFAFASRYWEVETTDLELRDGGVGVKGVPQRFMTYAELFGEMYHAPAGNIIGKSVFQTRYIKPDPETGTSPDMAAFWFTGGSAAEVEVDRETGKVRVLRLVSSADVGKAINPFSVRQQILGAGVMFLGQTFSEQAQYDHGQLVNGSMAHYKIPSFVDMPEQFEAIVLEIPDPEGPFGAKGAGEQGTLAVATAIANAIEDAIGVRIKDLPLTPERVLRAIRAAQAETGAEKGA